MGALMRVDPRIEVKAIEGDAVYVDGDLQEQRPHLGVEAVAVHPEIRGDVPLADQSREEGDGSPPRPVAAARKASHARSRSMRSYTRVVPPGVGGGSRGRMCRSNARRLRPIVQACWRRRGYSRHSEHSAASGTLSCAPNRAM